MCSLILSSLIAAMALGAAQSPSMTRVTGRVLDATTKQPVADARVVLQPVRGAPGVIPLGSWDAQTDEGGAFSLDVPSGRYLVIVDQPGFVRSDRNSPTLNRSISGRSVNIGDIRIRRGGAIEGRVFDANGTPMPDLSISVVPPGLNIRRRNEVGSPVGTSAQTNDLGAFRVSGVPDGKYYVVARPASRSRFNQQPVVERIFVNTYYPGSASPSGARIVGVAAGQTTTGIDFRLSETSTVTASGIVVDKRGWPIGAALVSFSLQDDRLGPPITATAHSDGTFTVILPDGKYRVEASRPIVVSQTSNSRSVRYEKGSRSVGIKIEGRPVSGIRVVADR